MDEFLLMIFFEPFKRLRQQPPFESTLATSPAEPLRVSFSFRDAQLS